MTSIANDSVPSFPSARLSSAISTGLGLVGESPSFGFLNAKTSFA
jgi:hypothetical protein